MSIGAIDSIRARMDSIDSRFARMTVGAVRPDGTTSFAGSLEAALGLDAIAARDLNTDDISKARAATATTLPNGQIVATSAPGAPGLAGAVSAGTPFAQEFESAGARHGVPPRLLAAVGWVESRYQVDAVSPDGAIGVMQIMPTTARELGVDPNDPADAIDGAARLLAAHHDRFGTWDLALAAYFSGAGAVSRAGNTPSPRGAEYVRRVNERLEQA